MADFALLESPKLISRKIWVIEKLWNFHTVPILANFNLGHPVSESQEIEEKENLRQKMENLCTSLFTVSTKISEDTKTISLNKLKGEDFLEENFMGHKFQFGPFAYLPTNIIGKLLY